MLRRFGFLRTMTPLVVCELPVSGLVSVCLNSARMLFSLLYAATARSMIVSAVCARAASGSVANANAIAVGEMSFVIWNRPRQRLCVSGFRHWHPGADRGGDRPQLAHE